MQAVQWTPTQVQETAGPQTLRAADCGASASHGWASAWVTRAIAAELSRLPPIDIIRLQYVGSREHIGEVSQKGSWSHFLDQLDRCACAQARQELSVANVEHSRRFSTCDALQTAATAVGVMMYKLMIRSPELTGEFLNVVEQLYENRRRFEAADVVLQRLFHWPLDIQLRPADRAEIVNAINAEMDKTLTSSTTIRSLIEELGHRGVPPRSGASASTGGAGQPADLASASTGGAARPADSEGGLLPRPPTTPSPSNLGDYQASDVQGPVEAQGRGFVHGHGKAHSVIGLRELERR